MIRSMDKSLESWVEGWFKLHAYSLILMRNEGTPVIFGETFTEQKMQMLLVKD